MIWFFLGLACLIIDFFFAQTLVILFFGIGAVITALLVEYGIVIELEYQILSFLVASTCSSVVLWRPLSRNKAKARYSNIIGGEVLLTDENLEPEARGIGRWSGTNVIVALEPNSKTAVKGDRLIITKISGNIFYVKNKEI